MPCCCTPPSLCPVCVGKTCEIDWPADGSAIDGVGYNKKGNGVYYSKTMPNIEYHPQAPAFLGYAGSSKSQSIWRLGTVGSAQIPAPEVPGFTWKQGYPSDLENCAYWVLDSSRTVGYGADCCTQFLRDPITGELGGCDSRGALLGDKGKFRWRLMLLDCNTEELIDITDDAITKTGIFEGTYNSFLQPLDRDCDSVDFIALPDYFDDPIVTCV